MRGNPLIQAVIAAFFILLLAWPVYRLTRPAAPPVTAGQKVAADKTLTYHLEIYFTGEPDAYTFEYLGKLLLDKRQSKLINRKDAGTIVVDLPPTVTARGVDIMAKISWPDKTRRQALEVKLVDQTGVTAAERTLWSTGGEFEGRIPLP